MNRQATVMSTQYILNMYSTCTQHILNTIKKLLFFSVYVNEIYCYFPDIIVERTFSNSRRLSSTVILEGGSVFNQSRIATIRSS